MCNNRIWVKETKTKLTIQVNVNNLQKYEFIWHQNLTSNEVTAKASSINIHHSLHFCFEHPKTLSTSDHDDDKVISPKGNQIFHVQEDPTRRYQFEIIFKFITSCTVFETCLLNPEMKRESQRAHLHVLLQMRG